MDNQVASIVFWLPLVVAVLVAVAAGLAADHSRSRRGPLLLRRPRAGDRGLATLRYVIDVGDSA